MAPVLAGAGTALAAVSSAAFDAWIVPAQFTVTFNPRGWIAHEDLPAETMRRALEVSQRDGLEAAEQFLVAAHDAAFITQGLDRLSALRCGRPERRHLLHLALIDYVAGRYHASTPVVLAQLDGIAQELTGRSFFGAPAEVLSLPHSVTASPGGLATLAKYFGAQRRITVSDPLDAPFRHGILHGRDLGYDTPLVAAKAWATLLALRPWAARVEAGSTTADSAWTDDAVEDWATLWMAGNHAYQLLVTISQMQPSTTARR